MRFYRSGRQAGGADTTPGGPNGGGEHWAVIASLVDTCKLYGVDPQAYFADVLARIVARHPMGRIGELLPFAYVLAADKAAA